MASRDPDTTADKQADYAAKARAANPEKYRALDRARRRPRNEKTVARQKLNAAVRSGAIKRPAICAECGKTAKTTGHHHDYAKPFDVAWLCYRCHGRRHRLPRAALSKSTPKKGDER